MGAAPPGTGDLLPAGCGGGGQPAVREGSGLEEGERKEEGCGRRYVRVA